MNTLYLLSGPPRVGKTTIMNRLVKKTGVQLVAADALEHGLRNVLTGEPHQLLRGIKLQGSAERKTTFTEVGDWEPFQNQGTESELLLQFIVGMLDYYRRNKESVAFEGTEFAPHWVSDLKLSDFKVKAAYVGYTDASHIESILAHAQNNVYDWINDWLTQSNGDETNIRTWATEQAKKNAQLKQEAASHGYPFFDISTMPFDEYLGTVQNYFLSD